MFEQTDSQTPPPKNSLDFNGTIIETNDLVEGVLIIKMIP